MFHPAVIAANVQRLTEAERALALQEGRAFPREIHGRPFAEVQSYVHQLSTAADPAGTLLRDLTADEQCFITSELILSRCDFTYWAGRYARIQTKGFEVIPFNLNVPQQLIVKRLAALEHQILTGEREDGLLALLLKARQLGGSSLAENIIVHRSTLQANRAGLVASDVPRPGTFRLLKMFTTCLDELPWFMRPAIEQRVESFPGLLSFKHKSTVEFAASKSTRGKIGQRGQVGRGGTYSLFHGSEISTWENPAQITSALMPAIPEPEPEVFVMLESTAKGEHSFWQKLWNLSKSGQTRFIPIFIPWYAEAQKYRRRAPVGWVPSHSTLAHAQRVYDTSPQWMDGQRVKLTPDQMYWYESRRAEYEAAHDLATFLEEFPADDTEAFQAQSNAVFTPQVIQRIKDLAKPVRAVVEIAPAYEIQKMVPEQREWTPLS